MVRWESSWFVLKNVSAKVSSSGEVHTFGCSAATWIFSPVRKSRWRSNSDLCDFGEGMIWRYSRCASLRLASDMLARSASMPMCLADRNAKVSVSERMSRDRTELRMSCGSNWAISETISRRCASFEVFDLSKAMMEVTYGQAMYRSATRASHSTTI